MEGIGEHTMCDASIYAVETRNVEIGETVGLKKTDEGQPFFHRAGDDWGLVSCIRHASRVTVTDLPQWMADDLAVDTSFSGVFVQDPRGTADDRIIAENGEVISLHLLFAAGGNTTTVEVTFVGLLDGDELVEINDQCVDIFDIEYEQMQALLVGSDWGYPFADQAVTVSTIVEIGELPAPVDVAGNTIDLEVVTFETQTSETQRKLENV